MITVVDRNKTAEGVAIVQKVTNPSSGRLIRYQYAIEAKLGDYSAITVASTLEEARKAIGKSQGGKIQVAADKPTLKLALS